MGIVWHSEHDVSRSIFETIAEGNGELGFVRIPLEGSPVLYFDKKWGGGICKKRKGAFWGNVRKAFSIVFFKDVVGVICGEHENEIFFF